MFRLRNIVFAIILFSSAVAIGLAAKDTHWGDVDILGSLNVQTNTDLDGTLNVDGASTLSSLGIGGSVGSDSVSDVISTAKGARPCPKMTEAQRDAISSPNSSLCVYNTDTDKYNVYDGSAWVELGSGTGLGGFSLDSDPYAQSVVSWAVHADQTDLDGGTTTGTSVTANATSTQILSDGFKGAFVWALSAADHSDKGVSKTYSIPEAMKGKPAYITLRLSSDVALAAGDLEVAAYDTYSTSLQTIYGYEDQKVPGISANGVITLTMRINIGGQPNDGNARSIRFSLNRATTDATATNIYFSGMKFSDDVLVDTPIVGYQGSYTPTLSDNTNVSTNNAHYWREDDRIKVSGYLEWNGAGAGTTFTVSLPSGLTINDNRNPNSASSNAHMRTATWFDNGTGFKSLHIKKASSTDSTAVVFTEIGANNIWDGSQAANGDILFYEFEAPIAEWANQSAVLSTKEMMNQTVDVSGKGNGGTSITANTTNIDFTEAKDTLNLWSGSQFTANKKGRVYFMGAVAVTSSTTLVLNSYIDGTIDKLIGITPSATTTHLFHGFADLEKDEVLSFRSNTGVTLSNSSTNHWIMISDSPNFSVLANYVLPPTIQTFTSGSGTYSTPSNVRYIKVRMVGGGGGGGGSGVSNSGGTGGNGGTTTFGSDYSATGGAGGICNGQAGQGGGNSVSGPYVISVAGGDGNSLAFSGTTSNNSGGNGGSSYFGGAGRGTYAGNAGGAGKTNSGSGGGGAGGGAGISLVAASGGGAGGYIEAIINNPDSSYSYAVGSGGAAGTAGTSGNVGGAGAAGIIIVEEYY